MNKEKKVVKKVVKTTKVFKPIKLEVEEIEVKKPVKVIEPIKPKIDVLKSESYRGVKIISISKREDGAYNIALANGTTTILDENQYSVDVK